MGDVEEISMAYQYGSCRKPKVKRVYEPLKPPIPTWEHLDLALRDVAQMGWGCATEWSQYVINWFERKQDYGAIL